MVSRKEIWSSSALSTYISRCDRACADSRIFELRYGEIMDVNMPRDSETGKTKGFGFVMYEDQRSTVLAVDNLNGGKVLDRTIRVDHVKNYRQKRVKNEAGELMEPEEQSLNARPELVQGGNHYLVFRSLLMILLAKIITKKLRMLASH